MVFSLPGISQIEATIVKNFTILQNVKSFIRDTFKYQVYITVLSHVQLSKGLYE